MRNSWVCMQQMQIHKTQIKRALISHVKQRKNKTNLKKMLTFFQVIKIDREVMGLTPGAVGLLSSCYYLDG